MNLIYSLMILFYWIFLSGIIFLAGAYVSRIYITGPTGAEFCYSSNRNRRFAVSIVRNLFLVAVLAFLANAIHFVLHCSVMTETPLKEVFSILPVFITKTKYGRFAILRTVLLAIILVISFVSIMHDKKWLTLSEALFSLLLLIAIAMSGHQGTKGYMNFPFWLDVLHLVAVSAWIGGIMFIRFFLSVFYKNGLIEFWLNLKSMMKRFSLLATYSVIAAGLTGLLLTYFNVRGFRVLMNTQYGIVLMVKIFLVCITMIIGGMNKFFIIPYMDKISPENSSEQLRQSRKLQNLVTIETGLGFLILLLTSILTHLSPDG